MRARPLLAPALLILLLLSAACSWLSDERSAVRARLQALRNEMNSEVPDGIGAVTHVAALASYFTEDVSVELGDGTAPISGREMLLGMAARLHGRATEFQVDLADVNVQLGPGAESAKVNLTAEFIRRTPTAPRSRDAREFDLTLQRDDGEWKISRVVAVRTLK